MPLDYVTMSGYTVPARETPPLSETLDDTASFYQEPGTAPRFWECVTKEEHNLITAVRTLGTARRNYEEARNTAREAEDTAREADAEAGEAHWYRDEADRKYQIALRTLLDGS